MLQSLVLSLIALGQEAPAPPATAPPAVGPAPLVVEISGLRNDEGEVLVSLWVQADGFPTQAGLAARTLRSELSAGAARVVFEAPPQGRVAVSVIHDENRNGALDTGFLGIPKEGVGASIGPDYGRLGPPRFQDAAFDLGAAGRSLKLRLTYLL